MISADQGNCRVTNSLLRVIFLSLPQPNPSGLATTQHLHPPTPMAPEALSASAIPTASSRTTRICTCRLHLAPPQICSE